MAAYEDVDSSSVAVWIEDVVIPRIGGDGVAALSANHGNHVIIVGVDHTQLCRRTSNPEIEVVVARVEPDLVCCGNLF